MEKEIEVKVKISNADDLIAQLEKVGFQFSEVIEQKDTIFAKPEVIENYSVFKHGDVVLRVRETQKGSYFTLKQTQTNELDCIEKETDISKPEEMKEAIKLMGYEYVTTVKKQRRKASKGEYEICIDKVEKLGDFIEVESITDRQDSGRVQEELLEFLRKFDVDTERRVEHGYDTLMVKLEGLN